MIGIQEKNKNFARNWGTCGWFFLPLYLTNFGLVNFFLKFLNRNSSTSGGVVTLKTGRREVPGSNPGRACRPTRSEFSVVFSETRVNIG